MAGLNVYPIYAPLSFFLYLSLLKDIHVEKLSPHNFVMNNL